MKFLEIKQLSAGYDGQKVIREISLDIQEGETGCIFGASGSGKTTLLRALAGFEPLMEGQILLNGKKISDSKSSLPPEKRNMGIVFQDFALFPHLTVENNILFGLRRWEKKERLKRVNELVSMLGLEHLEKSYPHEISGGQQQRVALARALAPRPALLLLDEPFSSLDPELRTRLTGELKTILGSQNITSLLVTHNLEEAFTLAQSIGVLHQGKVDQWGTPTEIYGSPATRYIASYLGNGFFLEGMVSGPGEIQTEIGIIRGTCSAEFVNGTEVEILIRQENIRESKENGVLLKVESSLYMGAGYCYNLKTKRGKMISATFPSQARKYQKGDLIPVVVECDSLICFKKNKEEKNE